MNNEDMSNLINKFSSYMNSSNNTGNSSISPEMMANMVKMFQNSNANSKSDKSNVENSESSSKTNASNFDMQKILKMKELFDKLNKNDDPRSNLLLSLKPYLRDSRKGKIESCIQLFNMSKIFEALNSKGDENAK